MYLCRRGRADYDLTLLATLRNKFLCRAIVINQFTKILARFGNEVEPPRNEIKDSILSETFPAREGISGKISPLQQIRGPWSGYSGFASPPLLGRPQIPAILFQGSADGATFRKVLTTDEAKSLRKELLDQVAQHGKVMTLEGIVKS
jgi:hypothetical protein